MSDILKKEEYFFLKQEGGYDFVLESQIEDPFYLANETFYTTCHKISRQNNPNFRKKPPYTFLENWLIHSLFSKSQQILLRFPVIHPRVIMTEGDFIYTPHQMVDSSSHSPEEATGSGDYYNEEDEDEEEYYDDDTFIIGDEGVIVMSAPAPDYLNEEESSSVLMDENTWMGHSKYSGNGLTLHVVNPDLEEKDEKNKRLFHNELSIVKEDNSEFVSMSPEVLSWYRSADLKSLKSNEEDNICSSSGSENTHRSATSECKKKVSHHSSKSYQSLADMLEEDTGNHVIYSQQISTTSYGTILQSEPRLIPPIMRMSGSFVDAAWKSIDIAQSYHENEENDVSSMVSCVFKIWKTFILGSSSILSWQEIFTKNSLNNL